MLHSFTSLFRKPTPLELALRELQEAERDVLQSQSQAEYATSMVGYHSSRIKRLKACLTTNQE